MEVERIILFESARDKAAEDYLRSPLDADNLIRWGGVLLELAHFYQGQASVNMLQDAVSKFEEALKINPKKHYALWCLGNALTSQSFLFSDMGKVNENLKKAEECYQKAVDEDPHNEHYLKALEMAKKAPSLHKEILKQLTSEQVEMNEALNIEGSSLQAPSLHKEILKQLTSEQVEMNEALNIEGSSLQWHAGETTVEVLDKHLEGFLYASLPWIEYHEEDPKLPRLIRIGNDRL